MEGMDMRKIAGLLLAAVLVTTGTACGSGDTPGTDFWGNPLPTEVPEEVCEVPTVAPVIPDSGRTRPASINPGWRWMVVAIDARALDPSAVNSEYCVPIDVHTYVREGEATWLDCGDGAIAAGPFDWHAHTPFVGRCVGLQYDPTAWADPYTAPSIEVHVDVRYANERDVFNTGEPFALSCSLRKGVGPDSNAFVHDTALVRDRQLVTCGYITADRMHWNDY